MKEQIKITYIGQRANRRHAYLVNGSTDEVYFKRILNKNHEVGAIYNATREPNEAGGHSYSAEAEEVGSFEDLEQVADWVRQDLSAREFQRVLNAKKKAETLARKCITPDLRRAWRNSGSDVKRKIVAALIESLEKRA